MEIIAFYCDIHKKYINTFCEQNTEMLVIKAPIPFIYHWGLNRLSTSVLRYSGLSRRSKYDK